MKKGVRGYGGIRTFPLISLLGATSAHLALTMNSTAVFVAAFSMLSLMIIVTHAYYSFTFKHSGITSELSAMLTFLIGASAILLPNIITISVAILLTIFLSFKKNLHNFTRNLEHQEFLATIKFVVITFIVLPLLPNTTIDPWGLFNPYKTWLYAVIITAISFGGYIAIKIIGKNKGIYTMGFIGGIVSSTSTTSLLAKKTQEQPYLNSEYRIGALLSYISSIIKVGIVLLLANYTLFIKSLPSLATLIIVGTILSMALISKTERRKNIKHSLEIKNPFTLKFALEFAIILTLVLTLSKFAQEQYGTNGIYITSLLSGIAKIDAITVSMAELASKCEPEQVTEIAKQCVPYSVAVQAIMIGAFFSAASKSVYAFIFGGKKFGKSLSPYILISGIAGLIISLLIG